MILDLAHLQGMYERKKVSTYRRGHPFNLSYQEFSLLAINRNHFKCFYTGVEFDLSTLNEGNYPTIDRIYNDRGYERGNVVLCTKEINSLKNVYIEQRRDAPEGTFDDPIALGIKALLANPIELNKRLEEYEIMFDNASEVINTKSKYEGYVKAAQGYINTASMFSSIGLTYEVSPKDHRDIHRRKRCAITGVKFTTATPQRVFVLDKAQPITKGNVVVCTQEAQDLMDKISVGDNKVLQNVGKFLTNNYK